MRHGLVALSFTTASILAGCSSTPLTYGTNDHPCTNNEGLIAVYDIGSGGPDVELACVKEEDAAFDIGYSVADPKTPIEEFALSSEEPNFRADLAKHAADNKGCFSPEIVSASEKWFEESARKIRSTYKKDVFRAIEFRGAATAAFRMANEETRRCPSGFVDGDQLLNKIVGAMRKENVRQRQIRFDVASNSDEGHLEFVSVAAKESLAPNKSALVMGFGSTSTQLTFWEPPVAGSNIGTIKFAEGLGQTLFRDHVIEKIKRDVPADTIDCSKKGTAKEKCVPTPNPIGSSNADEAERYAVDTLKKRLSAAGISSLPDGPIYGVGGALKYMKFGRPKVENCTRETKITLGNLKPEIKSAAPLARADLCNDGDAEFASTEVVNLISASATLTALDAKDSTEITLTKGAGLSDGLMRIKEWPMRP